MGLICGVEATLGLSNWEIITPLDVGKVATESFPHTQGRLAI